MADLQFTKIDNTWVLSKTKNGKTSKIVVTDTDGDQKLDNHDCFKVEGNFSLFTSSEVKTALMRANYFRSASNTTIKGDNTNYKYKDVPYNSESNQITVKSNTEYNVGSLFDHISNCKTGQRAASNANTGSGTGATGATGATSATGAGKTGKTSTSSTSIYPANFGMTMPMMSNSMEFGSASTLNPSAFAFMGANMSAASGMMGMYEMMGTMGNPLLTTILGAGYTGFTLGVADNLTSNFLRNNSACSFIDKYKDMDFSHLGESTETSTASESAAEIKDKTTEKTETAQEVTKTGKTDKTATDSSDEVSFSDGDDSAADGSRKSGRRHGHHSGTGRTIAKKTPNTNGQGSMRYDYTNGDATIAFADGSALQLTTNAGGERVCKEYTKEGKLIGTRIYGKNGKSTYHAAAGASEKDAQGKSSAGTQAYNLKTSKGRSDKRAADVQVEINKLQSQIKAYDQKCNNYNSTTLNEDIKKRDELKRQMKNLQALKNSPELRKLDQAWISAVNAYIHDKKAGKDKETLLEDVQHKKDIEAKIKETEENYRKYGCADNDSDFSCSPAY